MLLLSLTLGACSTAPLDPEDRADWIALNDPFEPTNRVIFDIDVTLDDYILAPIARAYSEALPDPVLLAIHNFISNLNSPWILVNDILQGNGARASETIGRFLVNSTVGLGGLFDVVAANNGPAHHDEDFGQTLAVWGVSDGPYLMLPLLGPSSPRDAAGLGAAFFGDPTNIVLSKNDLDSAVWARFGMTAVDDRMTLLDPLDNLRRTSLDYYAAIRSVYRQRRASLIANEDIPLGSMIDKGSRP